MCCEYTATASSSYILLSPLHSLVLVFFLLDQEKKTLIFLSQVFPRIKKQINKQKAGRIYSVRAHARARQQDPKPALGLSLLVAIIKAHSFSRLFFI